METRWGLLEVHVLYTDIKPTTVCPVEGDDDRTLESDFREHDKYYKRRDEALGFEFNGEMDVILERFELVYPV